MVDRKIAWGIRTVLTAAAIGCAALVPPSPSANAFSEIFSKRFIRGQSPSVSFEVAPRTVITHTFPKDITDPQTSLVALVYSLEDHEGYEQNGRYVGIYEEVNTQSEKPESVLRLSFLPSFLAGTQHQREVQARILYEIPTQLPLVVVVTLPIAERTEIEHIFSDNPQENKWSLYIYDGVPNPGMRNVTNLVFREIPPRPGTRILFPTLG